MNYFNHYNTLINRAKIRIIEGYVEKHHIIPRCMGGSDDLDNLVALTAREHFLAHLLLMKMYPENYSLVYAANMMTVNKQGNRINNRRYEWLKIKYSIVQKLRPRKKTGKETKPRKPRKQETAPRKPRIITDIHKQKIRESMTGKKKPIKTEEKKNNVSTVSKTLRNNEIWVCPKCGLNGKCNGNLTRHLRKCNY